MMKKIFLDESIFIGIFAGVRSHDLKYIELCNKIMLLSEQNRIRIFYSFSHIYQTAKRCSNESKVLEKLKDVQLLTNGNCILLEDNICVPHKLDPVKQYMIMQPLFSFMRYNSSLISKYFNISLVQRPPGVTPQNIEIPEEYYHALMEKEKERLILMKDTNLDPDELKRIIVRLKHNIVLFFQDFIRYFSEQLVYLFSHDVYEIIKINIIRMEQNIFERIRKNRNRLYTEQIVGLLNEMENLIEKIHTTEQLLPVMVQKNRSGKQGEPQVSKKRGETMRLLNIAFDVDHNNICDIFVLDESKESSCDEVVDVLLDNKNMLIQNSAEFIEYIKTFN